MSYHDDVMWCDVISAETATPVCGAHAWKHNLLVKWLRMRYMMMWWDVMWCAANDNQWSKSCAYSLQSVGKLCSDNHSQQVATTTKQQARRWNAHHPNKRMSDQRYMILWQPGEYTYESQYVLDLVQDTVRLQSEQWTVSSMPCTMRVQTRLWLLLVSGTTKQSYSHTLILISILIQNLPLPD